VLPALLNFKHSETWVTQHKWRVQQLGHGAFSKREWGALQQAYHHLGGAACDCWCRACGSVSARLGSSCGADRWQWRASQQAYEVLHEVLLVQSV
jgi:hypothetical protein